MNICIFSGRLTYDPEIKELNGGKVVATFSIAVNEGKDSDGNDRVEYVNCEAWGPQAELLKNFFKKGKPISVETSKRTETWETDGEKRRREKFVVKRISFVPGTKQESSNDESGDEEVAPTKPAQRKPVAKKKTFDVNVEEDVPF